MQQAIQRVDHVAIIVNEENARSYAGRLSAILGICFEEPFVNDEYGVLIIISWDAGLEIIAPTRKKGAYWDRLQRYGEGTVAIVFGVADMDEAIKRARDNGATVPFEVRLNGDEPWLTRFSSFREARLSAFGESLSCSFSISEIVPISRDRDDDLAGTNLGIPRPRDGPGWGNDISALIRPDSEGTSWTAPTRWRSTNSSRGTATSSTPGTGPTSTRSSSLTRSSTAGRR